MKISLYLKAAVDKEKDFPALPVEKRIAAFRLKRSLPAVFTNM